MPAGDWVLNWTEPKDRVRVAVANEPTFAYLLGELRRPIPRKPPPSGRPPRRVRGLTTLPDASSGGAVPAAPSLGGSAAAVLLAVALFAGNFSGSLAGGSMAPLPPWVGPVALQAVVVALAVALRSALPALGFSGAAAVAVLVAALAALASGARSREIVGVPAAAPLPWPLDSTYNCSGSQRVAPGVWQLCCYF